MKSSPMHRNFGIGSPAKHRTGKQGHDAAHDGTHPTANTFINENHDTKENLQRKKLAKSKETKQVPLTHRVNKPKHDMAHDGNHPTAETFLNDKHETASSNARKAKAKETKKPVAKMKSTVK